MNLLETFFRKPSIVTNQRPHPKWVSGAFEAEFSLAGIRSEGCKELDLGVNVLRLRCILTGEGSAMHEY
jgi:hypothetical protein